MAIGRISGPLLKANLLRERVDLAFENDLIYLQVNDALAANHRVGIKTSSPAYTLDVNGTTRTTNLKSGLIEVDNVVINNNSVAAALGDLTLTAATGTDKVLINSNTKISADLEVTGNLTFNGNINLGDANFDNIVINGEIASNFIPDLNGTYDIGSADKQWRKIYTNDISVTNLAVGGTIDNSEIYLTANTIGTVNPNVDLIFAPNGLGTVKTDDLSFFNNVIETYAGNTNLELRASGTGYVTFTDTSAIKIPVGTTAERLSGVTGQVRFNITTTQFEGYNGTAWSSLGGVRDIDGNTYIIPEATTGANDNTLWFYNDGVLSATLTTTALTLNPTTGSTSTTSGSLVVKGGAGIAENIYLGSNLVGSGIATSEIDSFTINGGTY